MCHWCVSRRGFGRAALAMVATAAARRALAGTHGSLVEPDLRLPDVASAQRTVALTFDACPGGFDMRIAGALVTARIPATIFVTQLWMQRNPDGLQLLLQHPDLFSLQNHGARHIPPVLGEGSIFGLRFAGDIDTIRAELRDGARAIATASGIAPRWYRAAAGFYTPSVIPVIETMGFAIGGYSFSADAGASLPPQRVAERYAAARNGDVIVAHINQPHRASGEGVVAGIRALQRQGVAFAHLPPPREGVA